MKHKKYEQIAYDEAKMSKCNERKVGAILVNNETGEVLAQGHNYAPDCAYCILNGKVEDLQCPNDVVHAEVACLTSGVISLYPNTKYTLYITQPPCNKCLEYIAYMEREFECSITPYVCEQFLKFDDDKNRMDLIPPEWLIALGRVLTYGAKKYKPNNWRKGEKSRYIGAIFRHFCAYLMGEKNDPETNMPHLWHMFTNVGFLITLEEQDEN